MSDFLARASRSMLVFSVAGGFGSSGFCLWAVEAFGPIPANYKPPNILFEAMLWFLIVTLGAAGLVAAVRLFRPRAVLRVGALGVRWDRWSDQLVPWSGISRVAVRDINFNRYIVLQLRDRRMFPPHEVERIVAPLNRLIMPFGDIWIHVAFFDRSYDELLLAFETFSPTGVVFEIRGRKPQVRQEETAASEKSEPGSQ